MTAVRSSSPLFGGGRASGILLHVASLPGPHGIGDLGPSARAWIDRLSEAAQGFWQTLPLCPVGKRNSPYESVSTFASNALLISPDDLAADGLLTASEFNVPSFPANRIDYDAVLLYKNALVERAWARLGSQPSQRRAFEEFCQSQGGWLEDYALFEVLSSRFGTANFETWPGGLRCRDPGELDRAGNELAEKIELVRFQQFLASCQQRRLKEYAHSRGVRLIGDLPFFIGRESADVWANPELFLLDASGEPEFVAGVPPDYFSENGQLWGNPVYDWSAHRKNGYRWWIARLESALSHVDVVRLDHFRGFAAAWHVPAQATSARTGQWRPGPGAELFAAVEEKLAGLPFIAEDLGLITPDVRALRDQFGLPGMRVLQFAFDGDPDNAFLPHNYVENCVAYTGTHDNDTTRGWFESLSKKQQRLVWKYLDRKPGQSDEVAWEFLRLAWSSPAVLAIAPLQDLLNLGSGDRMNVPGRLDENWTWRTTLDLSSGEQWNRLRELTIQTNRDSQLSHGN